MSTHKDEVEELIIDAVKKEEGLETKGPYILRCQVYSPPYWKYREIEEAEWQEQKQGAKNEKDFNKDN